MKMTLKLNELEQFVSQFKKMGFERVSDQQLNYSIAQKFGISPYIRNNIKKALADFDLIREESTGIWKIVWKMEEIKPEMVKDELSKYDEIINPNI
jgi:hypothetical protein